MHLQYQGRAVGGEVGGGVARVLVVVVDEAGGQAAYEQVYADAKQPIHGSCAAHVAAAGHRCSHRFERALMSCDPGSWQPRSACLGGFEKAAHASHATGLQAAHTSRTACHDMTQHVLAHDVRRASWAVGSQQHGSTATYQGTETTACGGRVPGYNCQTDTNVTSERLHASDASAVRGREPEQRCKQRISAL